MLIFDQFESWETAEAFAAFITAKYNRSATVYADQEESDAVDPIPCPLSPPIVLVERRVVGEPQEQEIEALVGSFGGRFAGT
jgi:hypothetical protein